MSKNELAVTSENFDLQILAGDMAEALAEEMDGLGTIPFDKVKIPSGGSVAFEVPTDDEDNPDTVKELVGVILYHHPVNGYWKNKYDGQNNQPDCTSYDGKVGILAETGECRNCATCVHNQFGSDENGRGKACKNMHRCYLLREGNPIPIILTLPPTSLKSLRDYIGKKIVIKGMRSYQVITKITLKKDTSGDGITYSKAVFTPIGTLEGEKLEMAKQYAESVKASNQNVEITEDDFGMAPASNTTDSGFRPVEDSEELPFHDVPPTAATEPEFEAAEAVQEELPV